MNSFILLDTNVILDFAMKRGEHYVSALGIMKVTRDKEGFINSGLQVYSPEEFLEVLK